MRIPWLNETLVFPDVTQARREPNGLLCAGGDLSVPRLREAYQRGIFPWFNEGEAILWWSPDPRCVLFPEEFVLSARDWRALRNSGWHVHSDRQFAQVLAHCAAPRANYPDAGTWLTPSMQAAYLALFEAGSAHSVEIYEEDTLIAGIYGVAIGSVFSAESMFGTRNNASKAALAALVLALPRMGMIALDAQVSSDHLLDRGAREISRDAFQSLLQRESAHQWQLGAWPTPWACAKAVAVQK
jgi:leucyl/phenylalanyl-tRNA---protein transferase